MLSVSDANVVTVALPLGSSKIVPYGRDWSPVVVPKILLLLSITKLPVQPKGQPALRLFNEARVVSVPLAGMPAAYWTSKFSPAFAVQVSVATVPLSERVGGDGALPASTR